MARYLFRWDDSAEGNVLHLAAHEVTPEEAAYVVEHAIGHASNRNGDPIAFGYTPGRRHLAVAYWFMDEAETTVYVETAYDTPAKVSRNRR